MTKTLTSSRKIAPIIIPLILFGVVFLLSQSTYFITYPSSLSLGITADLLFTIPLVYFLLIRKTLLPKTTIVLVLVISMLIGYAILPSQNQYYLELFKTWVFPLLELSIIGYVIYKVTQAIKTFKNHHNSSLDFYTVLKNTCHELLPKGFVIPVVTEIAVFYYGLVKWKKRRLHENEFTYHKESGTTGLLIGIILVVGIETFVVHHFLMKWSPIAAWVLSFLSVYSAFQLLGFLKSIVHRPIVIEEGELVLRNGIMKESVIKLSSIDSVQISSKELEFNDTIRRFSFLGELDSYNIILTLKEEGKMTGLYGVNRNFSTLAFHVDDRERFVMQLEEAKKTSFDL